MNALFRLNDVVGIVALSMTISDEEDNEPSADPATPAVDNDILLLLPLLISF